MCVCVSISQPFKNSLLKSSERKKPKVRKRRMGLKSAKSLHNSAFSSFLNGFIK